MDPLLHSNLDDILRTALTLADRGLIPKERSREWYGQVVLGEISPSELLIRIEKGVSDPVLARHVANLKWDVPFHGEALGLKHPTRNLSTSASQRAPRDKQEVASEASQSRT